MNSLRANKSVSAPANQKSANPAENKEASKKKRGARSSPPVAQLNDPQVLSEKAVKFAYQNPDAREVFIAGSFNDWNPQATPLTQSGQGRWTTTLLLKPGTHEYRFVVDGVWREDPSASASTPNPFEGSNSVVVVQG